MATPFSACIAMTFVQHGMCNIVSSGECSAHAVFNYGCCVPSRPMDLSCCLQSFCPLSASNAFISNSVCTSCVVSQGQGMTVGMMGSNLLCQCIDKLLEGCTADCSKQQQLAALDRLPTQFHTELGALVNYPWSVAAGADAMCALSCLAKIKPAWCSCSLRKCTSCTGKVSAELLLQLYMLI